MNSLVLWHTLIKYAGPFEKTIPLYISVDCIVKESWKTKSKVYVGRKIEYS